MLSPWFAIAGLAAASGPVIIHLLNRRRFRTVQWAAMDFLRNAVQRSRRMLQWRDLLLLILRTACVLLFGLALSRPYWASDSAAVIDPDQPLHLILVVDNSLSMDYSQLKKSLLDQAKQQATGLVDQLPNGSRVSVLPLCGTNRAISKDPYRTLPEAKDAIQNIQIADQIGQATEALNLALEASQQAPELPSKRVVLLSDQQTVNWPSASLEDQFASLPEVQLVQVAYPESENAWISEFRLQDEIADTETSARLLVKVRYEGRQPREDVQVRLFVQDQETLGSLKYQEVASQSVDLTPGQTREVEFMHRFDVPVQPGEPSYVAVKAMLSADDLDADNSSHLVVPVVAALPVVFVDQYGPKEDLRVNQIGETYDLRRLLVPIRSQQEYEKPQLIQIRHVTANELDRPLLEETRLVVIAGVEEPTPEVVELLREYVEQGGSLFVAAGANFDPVKWQEQAWQDGAGILPLPLKPDFIGHLPDEHPEELTVFRLDPESMLAGSAEAQTLFRIPQESEETLKELYQAPYFFKAIAADSSPGLFETLKQQEIERIEQQREARKLLKEELAKVTQQRIEAEGQTSSPSPREVELLEELESSWLLWTDKTPELWKDVPPEELARARQPIVLAEFDNGSPFLVQRQVGHGRVVLATSGIRSGWNSLTKTYTIFMYDRLLRTLIDDTLPQRALDAGQRFTLPIDPADRAREFTLVRPDGRREVLAVEALGGDRYGLSIRDADLRGHYLIVGRDREDQFSDQTQWQIPISVHGPPEESDLRVLNEETLTERMGKANYRWLDAGESITLEGAAGEQSFWWWLLVGVLALLLLEMLILAWPMLPRRTAA